LVVARAPAALATLGIVIGLTTILLMVTIIQGLNESVGSQLSKLGSRTLYVDKFPWATEGNLLQLPQPAGHYPGRLRRHPSHSRYAVYITPTVGRGSPSAAQPRPQ
jgi:hypothetical protein